MQRQGAAASVLCQAVSGLTPGPGMGQRHLGLQGRTAHVSLSCGGTHLEPRQLLARPMLPGTEGPSPQPKKRGQSVGNINKIYNK